MPQWNVLPDDSVIRKTADALLANGISVLVADNREEARQKLQELIPEGSEVMTMTSQTNEATGANELLNESGKYSPVRGKFAAMDPKTQQKEMNALGAAPMYATGSVHAVTQEGQIMVASATGSQLPAYAYAAMNVVWVVGAHKIVKNLDEGFKRIYEYSFPLENERAKKAYGKGSGVNKLLIINKEVNPSRLTMIIVKEALGF
jgi:L-lactate utilization protein LutC